MLDANITVMVADVFNRRILAIGDHGALWPNWTSNKDRYGQRTNKDIQFGFVHYNLKDHKRYVRFGELSFDFDSFRF